MSFYRLAPLCLGLLTLFMASAFAAESAKPNIVFILADDNCENALRLPNVSSGFDVNPCLFKAKTW